MKSIQLNIDNTSTSVTNIDKSIRDIKLGFESLLKLNGSLPRIEAELTLIQNNLALLSSIELRLKSIESSSSETSGGVTKINANLTALAEIKKVLDVIQTTLSRIEDTIHGGKPAPAPQLPITVRIDQAKAIVDKDWSDWQARPWLPPSGTDPFTRAADAYNKIVDGLQLGLRWINGLINGFGARPVNSLVIAAILALLTWSILLILFGRIAYLYVPAGRVGNVRSVPLSLFKEFGNEWRIITPSVIVSMMMPNAIQFGSNTTFDWTKHRVIGFRRARKVDRTELASNQPGPLPLFWNRLPPGETARQVQLPRRPHGFKYARAMLTDRARRLSGRTTADSSDRKVESYLPGLLRMPHSGTLLRFLWLSSWVGYVVVAILISGIVAALKL